MNRLVALSKIERRHLDGIPMYTITWIWEEEIMYPADEPDVLVPRRREIQQSYPLFFDGFRHNTPCFTTHNLDESGSFRMLFDGTNWIIKRWLTTWELPPSRTNGLWIQAPERVPKIPDDDSDEEFITIEFSREFVQWYNSCRSFMGTMMPPVTLDMLTEPERGAISILRTTETQALPRLPSEIILMIITMLGTIKSITTGVDEDDSFFIVELESTKGSQPSRASVTVLSDSGSKTSELSFQFPSPLPDTTDVFEKSFLRMPYVPFDDDGAGPAATSTPSKVHFTSRD